MRPGDHPDFYHLAPPPGASRESSIVLDREGRFFHEGARVERPALERAMRAWIARHPDDGRLILTNGYDWCYFRAEDAPFQVHSLRVGADDEPVVLELFDGSEEPLDPTTLRVGDDGVVYATVKNGAFEARFSRDAQAGLAPILVQAEPPIVRVAGRELPVPPRTSRA